MRMIIEARLEHGPVGSEPIRLATIDRDDGQLQRVAPLLKRYPVDPRDHRPFLRAFLCAVVGADAEMTQMPTFC